MHHRQDSANPIRYSRNMTVSPTSGNALKAAAAIVAVATIVLCVGCSDKASANRPAEPQAFPVKVITAEAKPAPLTTEYLATLKSRNASVLQPQVDGWVTRIFVTSGQRVTSDAPILEIDPSKQEATVNNQEAAHKSRVAQMNQNLVDLNRKKQLYASGIIAKSDLDLAQAAYDTSRADVEALEASTREQKVQLRYYTVRAPTAGMVGDIPVRVGDHVTPQTTLTTLDRGGELEAYVNIPAEKSGSVRVGMPLDLLDDSGKPVLRTRISFISPHIETETQTLLVKAQVPNADTRFRNAQQVHSRIVWSEEKRPTIPVTAVSRLSGKMFAFVAEGQGQQAVARQKAIDVGDIVGNDYVVLSGIKPGEKIIVSNVQLLADGMPVVPSN
jgi:RND family efflux transporter MFP subunit